MFAAGVGSGFLLGLIGTGVIVAIAASTRPKPNYIPNENIMNEQCYRGDYSEKGRKKNIRGALGGGLIGTAVAVILIVSIASSSGSSGY
ncbi:unnamed protein product [marine sediment metagenome]|uniref:Uncharacterized protein n=1 Tax=marine sediment metagenome TaxID=412755 RepID=X1U9R7_9ZZZZ